MRRAGLRGAVIVSNTGNSRYKQDVEIVKSACLAGDSFEFTTEADGTISVKNLEGRGKLHITQKSVDTVDLPDADKKLEFNDIRSCIKDYLLKNKNQTGSSGQVDDNVSFWNNGRPLWKDLESNAGTGPNTRLISWEDGCYLCEAENDASLTKCYATVAEAKASGWSNGFSGFHPKAKAWCSPSPKPIGGVSMELNTRNHAIMLR